MENIYFEIEFTLENEPYKEQGFISGLSFSDAVKNLLNYYDGEEIINLNITPIEWGPIILPKEVCDKYMEEY